MRRVSGTLILNAPQRSSLYWLLIVSCVLFSIMGFGIFIVRYVEKLMPSNKVMDRLLPIHRAAELNASEYLMQALITAFEDGVKLKDHGNRWVPLHFCCSSVSCVSASSNNYAAFNLLVGAYREGAKVRDALGRMPLHIACENGDVSKNVIEILLVAYPDSCRVRDKSGKLPLHGACINLASEIVIQLLLRAYPDSKNIMDYNNKFPIDYVNESIHPNQMVIIDTLNKEPAYWHEIEHHQTQGHKTVEDTVKSELYRLIEKKQWNGVLDRIRRFPGEARQWYVLRHEGNGKCWWKQLPVHELAKLQPPTAVMDAVLEAYPEGAQTVDFSSILPIHLACRGQASTGVISCLIDAYPNGVRVKEKKGMLPLHCAVWGGASEEVINLLINAYPQSIDVVDNYGRTPLKVMTEKDQDFPALEMIIASLTSGRTKTDLYKYIEGRNWEMVMEKLEGAPKEASIPYIVKDSYGGVLSCKLPLHLAVSQKDTPVHVVEQLLNKYAVAAFQKGNGLSLPIHCAIANGASEEIVETLLRAHPLSVYEKDLDGNLPIFYARESSYPHKDAVISMLSRDPIHWKAPKICASSTTSLSASQDRTELFQLIVKKEWDEAVLRCKENPNEAKVWHVLQDDEGQICWQQLPLHQCCKSQPPVELVRALIEAYEDGPQTKDGFGDFPVHLACDNNASEEVITMLVKAFPAALHESDNFGLSPHAIIQERGHEHLVSLQQMMDLEAAKLGYDSETHLGEDPNIRSNFSMNRLKDSALNKWLEDDDRSGFADWQSVDRYERRSSHLSAFSQDSLALDSYAPPRSVVRKGRRRSRRNSRLESL